MAKEKMTKEVATSMINEFKGGKNDTRKDLFEAYFSISDKYEITEDYDAVISEIGEFLRSISTFIQGVGMSDKEWLKAEEKYYIKEVNEILSRNNDKEKLNTLLLYSRGEVVEMGWLSEEEKYNIDYLPMPIVEFIIKNFISKN